MRMSENTKRIIEYWKRNRDKRAGEIAKALSLPYITVKNVLTHYTPRESNAKLVKVIDARLDEMFEAIKKGYTIKEVAEMYGANPRHLYYIMRRRGIRRETKFQKILRLISGGFSIAEIMKSTGCEKNDVYQARYRIKAMSREE